MTSNDSSPAVAAGAPPPTKDGVQEVIDSVLAAYPAKARKLRSKHVKPNDPSGTDEQFAVKANIKSRPVVMTTRVCAYADSKVVICSPVTDQLHLSHGPHSC